jgi:2-oxoisovalerate dehydrogenase E1 component beta subunit
LASIRDPNPVLYFEPKVMYRSAVQEVPVEDYEIPLGKARIVREVRSLLLSMSRSASGPNLHVLVRLG